MHKQTHESHFYYLFSASLLEGFAHATLAVCCQCRVINVCRQQVLAGESTATVEVTLVFFSLNSSHLVRIKRVKCHRLIKGRGRLWASSFLCNADKEKWKKLPSVLCVHVGYFGLKRGKARKKLTEQMSYCFDDSTESAQWIYGIDCDWCLRNYDASICAS